MQPYTVGKGRFESFSDGVFAIAITLLILEIHLPSSASADSTAGEQIGALLAIWPQYLVYVASFATIGIMWLNHHALFDSVRRVTYGIVAANLVLLLLISFLPFPTEVLSRFGLSGPAVVYYGIVVSGIAIAYSLVYWQVLQAHPGSGRRFTAWNAVGLTFYPSAAVVGYFVPLLGVLLFVALAAYYAMPGNVRAARIQVRDPGA